MLNVWFIIQKELKIYFSSSLAYATGAFFLAIVGYFFSLILFYSRSTSFDAIFNNMAVILIFILPLISMRLISEERKSGTLEILLTKPIKDWQIIWGKFLSSWILLIIYLLFTLNYIFIVQKYGKIELSVILSGYLGISLFAACILAIGVFASSITSNQIVAAIITFALALIIWLLSSASTITGGNENIISYLALSNHLDDFIKGVINLKNSLFYLTFTVFWLYLATRTLEARNWKQ